MVTQAGLNSKGFFLSVSSAPIPVLIGISIHQKEYYHLSWIPSESGPLIIDYGVAEKKDDKIPFNYFLNRIKKYNTVPCFTLSLSNSYMKYNFTKFYNNVLIDDWNKNHFYDSIFNDLYDSYIYESKSGNFNIHILKSIKENIINQMKKKKYSLTNLGAGIFSALDGVNAWYNIRNLKKYIILKLSKRRNIELLLIDDNIFSGYVFGQKKSDCFNIIDFYGDKRQKNKITKIIDLIFKGELESVDSEKIFYYSINGNKEDNNLLLSLESEKLTLINPFKNLKFDDNCEKNITKINTSAYSELGNAFGGVDV